MTVRVLAVIPVALVVLGTVLPAAEPTPAGSMREIAYFGRGGPARLRLHVLIDRRPADAVWTEAVDALFAFCDRNGDGDLDATEQAVFAPPRRGREPEVLAGGAPVLPPLRLSFNSKNVKVTRAEFSAGVREAGHESVSLTVVAARADSEQLSAALFRHLDQDGDGKLSAGELKAAREQLAFLDVNEDELLSVAELLGRAVGAQTSPRVVASEEQRESAPDLRMLSGDPSSMAKQLLAALGGARATAIRRADLGNDEKTTAALDKNGDGRLDAAELEQWLSQPRDCELSLSFESGEQPARLSMSPSQVRSRVELGGKIEWLLPRARFYFEVPGQGDREARSAWTRTVDQARGRLKTLADSNGHVAQKQLMAQPDLLTFFDFADRNGDGRLDAAEVEAALSLLVRLAGCRATITFRDQGSGLFELLDRNGDGRLSPRQLAEAGVTLRPHANPIGIVGPEDLPRRYVVRVAAGSIPAVLSPATASPSPTVVKTKAAPSLVPTWSQQMDRNGDGDVSLREFLGPLELFRRFDQDGDGLISAQEAKSHH